jgi:hypothetical protein
MSICIGYSSYLTDKEEELHARLNSTLEIEPTHNPQDSTRNDLSPEQRDITGDLLPAVPRRARLSNSLGDVKERDAQGQAPGDGGDVQVGFIGKIVDVIIWDEKTSAHLERPVLSSFFTRLCDNKKELKDVAEGMWLVGLREDPRKSKERSSGDGYRFNRKNGTLPPCCRICRSYARLYSSVGRLQLARRFLSLVDPPLCFLYLISG